ncbi:MAG: TIGR00341 family protein [Pseudomonadota bacterium]
MSVRMITVSAPDQTIPPIRRKAEELGASGIRTYAETQREGRTTLQMLVGSAARQDVVDAVQAALSAQKDWRLTILPVETTVPLPRDEEEAEKRRKKASETKFGGMTREEVWNTVWGQARLDETYLTFVVLSTIVAALGMLTDSVAVVVGAMVIAPLLGPNLAFSVGVALGDGKLTGRALVTNVVGLLVALALSIAIGFYWTGSLASDELLARSGIGFDGLVIALASGAAAALSLTTGVSSALVGVMVAVALLPPTSAIGIFLGSGQFALAAGSAMLLAVNIVSVNIAAHTILFWRGIRPRTFFEDKRARRGRIASATVWILLLSALVALMWSELHR